MNNNTWELKLDSHIKYDSLLDSLKQHSRVAVAVSGGVDSALLLYAACEALGKADVFALRGVSELVSEREKMAASGLLTELSIPHENIRLVTLHPLIWNEFVVNTSDRCYFCKKRMYKAFQHSTEGMDCTAILDGTNVDDLKSHRPGLRAIHELGVETPLLNASLNKEEIRSLSAEFGLSTHDKPSNSCLATRIREGSHITKESLERVERCENFMIDRGFLGGRVKFEGSDIVLQVRGDDAERLATVSLRVEVIHFFKSMGAARVLLDLQQR